MAYLGNSPARSFISFERQVFTIVNSQTAYTLDHSVTNENDIRLVVNNVVQEPGSGKAYTASGTTLTLSAALTNGTDEMYCVFLGRAVGTVNAPAGSVGTSQLASDAVTEAKIADGAVESEHLNNNVISGQTELAAEPADTDEFLVSDAGTIKRIDYSHIKATAPDLVKLSSAETSSSATTIEFTGLDTSTYRCYMVTMQNLCFTSGNNMDMLWGTSSAYQTNNCNSALISDNVRNTYGASSQIRVLNSMSNAFSGVMWLLPAPNSNIESAQRGMFGHFVGHQRDHGDRRGGFVCNNNALAGTAFAKFKLFPDSSATFEDGGTVTVYGVKY